MGILNQIAQFLLSLSILVFLHEMGHYTFARLFNTRVEKFYLFFNPWFSLFKFKKGETEYGIGWLPLGGYCKIAGMIDESMDKDQMLAPPQPFEYRSKPTWQRFLIISGGVLVNFILALVIYSVVLYTWGEEYLPTQNAKYGVHCSELAKEIGFKDGDKILRVGGEEVESFFQIAPKIVLEGAYSLTIQREGRTQEIEISESYLPELLKSKFLFLPRFPLEIGMVIENSPAESAGFMIGDKLAAINNTPALYFDEFSNSVRSSAGDSILITVNRNGALQNLHVKVSQDGTVGIYPIAERNFLELESRNYTLLQSIPAGISRGANTISSYLKQLKLIFSPKAKAYESVGGFITIGSIFPKYWNWQSFWELTALISIILAIMNMLPIPALDGGHMLFLIYEMASGRKPSDKFMEYAQIAGMLFILALVFFANANDVVKLFR
ncbi:MAG: RIP metalloprotease RseP [Bacteroidales bacterium]|jgi:regulator of sigma E protease|nr:RIP metalloprotease RseP [Bacteroidales bacterium]MDD4385403.1 RIP metalloprotease RseP [Bacteroidales bacterium]MDY0197162.1 RIP metalloprotease RseP [Tenuifilaceae bacterium]